MGDVHQVGAPAAQARAVDGRRDRLGTVSLLLLLSFGEGLKRQLKKGSAGMGSGIAVIFPGETTKPWQGMASGRPIRPTFEDVALLRDRVLYWIRSPASSGAGESA